MIGIKESYLIIIVGKLICDIIINGIIWMSNVIMLYKIISINVCKFVVICVLLFLIM